MRLTDQPSRLAAMKPDVNWPEEVQAVMDRALERDAKDRYQTASEFGRALYKAIEGMPESVATSAFTAVMSPPVAGEALGSSKTVAKTAPQKATDRAVPPTRVSDATPPSSRAGAQGAQGARGAPARRTPLVAGIAAAVVLFAGGGAYLALGRGRGASTASAAQQSDSLRPGQQVTSPTPVNLARELENISPLVDDSATAIGALDRLTRLESALGAAPDSTLRQFQYLRAKALISSGAIQAGCDSLKNIEGKLAATRFARAAGVIISSCS